MTSSHSTSGGGRSSSDVVFTFSYETFTDAVSRGMMRPPDRLLSTLLSSPEVRRLVVANPYRSVASVLRRSMGSGEARFPEIEGRFLHQPARMGREDPVELAALQRTYSRYERSLAAAARRHGLDKPRIVTLNPLVAGFGDFEWASGITYYGRDDWLSSPARQKYWPAYKLAYERMASRGVAVAAVSQEIIDRIAPTGPHAVVPNGVEAADWLQDLPEPPRWFEAIPGPRAVYVGTLDSRLDIEGLASLAAARPDVHIVLIGPLPDASYVGPLERFANVHVHGNVGRPELVAVLRNAELTLLAHRRTSLTQAMSPLKVYEYLAAGAPVIATDLPPVRGLGGRVLLTDSVADFADVIDEALALGPASERDRVGFVETNAWPGRHKQILDLAR